MRGVGVMEFGGPEALEVVELPEAHAGAGEVRLRVHAATVNPTDTFVRGAVGRRCCVGIRRRISRGWMRRGGR